MYPIKQSTAITVPFFVHDANGDAVTSLTDGSFTKRISKNGAAFGAMTVTITEMENGWYSIPLSTSHSDTTGLLSVIFTNGGAKQVNLQFRVGAKLTDDLNDVAATDIVSSGAITTSGGAANADLIAAQSNTVTFPALNITGLLNIDDGIDISCSTGNRSAIAATGNGSGSGMILMGGTTGHGLFTLGSGTSGYGLYAFGAGTSAGIRALGGSGGGPGAHFLGNTTGEGLLVDGGSSGASGLVATSSGSSPAMDLNPATGVSLNAPDGITGDITGNLSGSVGSIDNLSPADVNTQVDTALSDIHLDHLFATNYDPTSKPGVATALLNELIESDAGVSRYTANALEQGPGGGAVTVGTINAGAINAASIAASALDGKGNWNIGKTGYTLLQTFPTNFSDLAITATTGRVSVGAINNDVITAAVIATGAIDADALAAGAITATTIAANAIGSSEIAAGALNGKGDWNVGKTGYTVSALGSNVITAASINASALDGKGDWNVGKTGYTVSALGAGVVTAASIAASALDGKGDWNTVTPDAAGVAATPAEVLTNVNTALDTAISELSQAQPSATPSVRTGLMLMYMALRNKTDVGTSGADELQIHNDAGTVITKKSLTDTAGDYSEAKMVSGP